MNAPGVGLVRTAITDDGMADNQAGPVCLSLGCPYCWLNLGRIHAIDGANHVPAIGFKPLTYVLREGNIRVAFNGNAVVVVEVDHFAQTQGSRQGSRLRRHTLLKVAVGYYGVGVVVNNFMSRPVIPLGQPALGNGHSHAIGEPLTQRASGRLDARLQVVFRVARSFTAPLAEALQIVKGDVIAG